MCVCEPSSRKAETGRALGHTGQPASLNPWAPVSLRESISKTKVESAWRRHPTLTSGLHMCTRMHMYSNHTHAIYIYYKTRTYSEISMQIMVILSGHVLLYNFIYLSYIFWILEVSLYNEAGREVKKRRERSGDHLSIQQFSEHSIWEWKSITKNPTCK